MVCNFKKVLLISFVVIFTLAFAPGIPPHVPFAYIEQETGLPLSGSFALNNKLENVEHMFQGHLHGPESIASRKSNELFVGVHGGDLIRIFGEDFNSLEVISHGNPCNFWEEHNCGRALGLRFAPNGKLIVADAYNGILEVNVDTGKTKTLVNSSLPIDGKRPMLPDDVDIDRDGNIYWSDASTNYGLDNAFLDLVTSPSGRLLKYDPKTKTNEVLLERVHFANGVQLSPDGSFVLVDECFKFRVIRYWLKGPKAGTSDIFISGLPGMPDNLRARPEGGYYVSLVNSDQFSSQLFKMSCKLPTLRKVAVRAAMLLKLAINSINYVINSDLLHWMSYKLFHLETYASSSSHAINTVIISEEGQVLESLQTSADNLSKISETVRIGNFLFFGSPYNHYLGRISLDKIKTPDHKTKENLYKDEL